MTDELPKHLVAVTVFTLAEGVDYNDACYVAENAIGVALRETMDQDGVTSPLTLLAHTFAGYERRVVIEDIAETSRAIARGSLTVRPTGRGYPGIDN